MNVLAMLLTASVSGGLGLSLAFLGAAGLVVGGSEAETIGAISKLVGGLGGVSVMIWCLIDYKGRVDKLTKDLATLNEARAEDLKAGTKAANDVLHECAIALQHIGKSLDENARINQRLMERLQ